MVMLRYAGLLLCCGFTLVFAIGCGGPAVRPTDRFPSTAERSGDRKPIPRLGFTIQAGAFAHPENAARFADLLRERGLDSTYFVARRGLYKVRFGNFPTKERARSRAEELLREGVIEEFYLVRPEEYALATREARGEAYVREEIVRTAMSFLGVPYLWGGSSVDTGFDCSGLAMTVYQLNGLDLPRTAREQFEAGIPVDVSSLSKGDLIFFAASDEKVSHVGIYAGGGTFIHAPGRGRTICRDALGKEYFSRSYAGARSYL